MTKGIHKKLAKARSVAHGAGFLLVKLREQFGDQFGVGLTQQVNSCINDCHQQGSALMVMTAKNAVQAERMHERRAKNIADNPSTPKGASDEPARSQDG